MFIVKATGKLWHSDIRFAFDLCDQEIAKRRQFPCTGWPSLTRGGYQPGPLPALQQFDRTAVADCEMTGSGSP
ncbi:hypothetical protein EV291_1902 [Rhizobium sp. BK068]|nr:hypothetical protein EV291_1902 [Rhizobium sp. BK068]